VGDNSAWTGSDGKITVWDTETLECFQEIEQPGNVVLSIMHDGKNVWTGGTDQTIRVYAAETGELVKVTPSAHRKIFCFVVASNGKVWSAHEDGTLCVWDPKTFALEKELRSDQSLPVFHMEALGDTIWTCSRDEVIRVWCANEGKQLAAFNAAHTDTVSLILPTWNKMRRIWQLWSASWDGAVCSYDINNALANIPPPQESNPKQPQQQQQQARIVRRPSIMVTPMTVDASRLSLVPMLQNPTTTTTTTASRPSGHRRRNAAANALRHNRRMSCIDDLKESEDMPQQWRTLAQRKSLVPEAPIEALVTAALRSSRSSSPPATLIAWFKSKNIHTCANLSHAPDELWTELERLAGKRILNALSTVLCFVKEPHKQEGPTTTETAEASATATAEAEVVQTEPQTPSPRPTPQQQQPPAQAPPPNRQAPPPLARPSLPPRPKSSPHPPLQPPRPAAAPQQQQQPADADTTPTSLPSLAPSRPPPPVPQRPPYSRTRGYTTTGSVSPPTRPAMRSEKRSSLNSALLGTKSVTASSTMHTQTPPV